MGRRTVDNKLYLLLYCDFYIYNFLTILLCLKTEALAQTNSEATRALAVQEDILEKELGEIQKVLLAMQVTF